MMYPSTKALLKEYVSDTVVFHGEHHAGSFEECEMTGCRLAKDLMSGRVDEGIYLAIIEGKEKIQR